MVESTVEVVFGVPERQLVAKLPYVPGQTVRDVIHQSGHLQAFELDLTQLEGLTGIWGKICKLEQQITPGDRVEIYRPLKLTPNEARQLRLSKKQNRGD